MSGSRAWLIREFGAARIRTGDIPEWARPLVTRPLSRARHRKPGPADRVSPTAWPPRTPRHRKEP